MFDNTLKNYISNYVAANKDKLKKSLGSDKGFENFFSKLVDDIMGDEIKEFNSKSKRVDQEIDSINAQINNLSEEKNKSLSFIDKSCNVSFGDNVKLLQKLEDETRGFIDDVEHAKLEIGDIRDNLNLKKDHINKFLENVNSHESSMIVDLEEAFSKCKDSFMQGFENNKTQYENTIKEEYEKRLTLVNKALDALKIDKMNTLKTHFSDKIKSFFQFNSNNIIKIFALLGITALIIFVDFLLVYEVIRVPMCEGDSPARCFANNPGIENTVFILSILFSGGLIFAETLNIKVFKKKFFTIGTVFITLLIIFVPMFYFANGGIQFDQNTSFIKLIGRLLVFGVLVWVDILLLNKYFEWDEFIDVVKSIGNGIIGIIVTPIFGVKYIIDNLATRKGYRDLDKNLESAKYHLSEIKLEYTGSANIFNRDSLQIGNYITEKIQYVQERLKSMSDKFDSMSNKLIVNKSSLAEKIDIIGNKSKDLIDYGVNKSTEESSKYDSALNELIQRRNLLVAEITKDDKEIIEYRKKVKEYVMNEVSKIS